MTDDALAAVRRALATAGPTTTITITRHIDGEPLVTVTQDGERPATDADLHAEIHRTRGDILTVLRAVAVLEDDARADLPGWLRDALDHLPPHWPTPKPGRRTKPTTRRPDQGRHQTEPPR
ncbi:hypothetical protein ACFRCG_39730 [Embleya sp. NPDC056575]|uniref:hypothetical protein n=1 Tax=unclassified Embleya TaxID=2699296 RepID=UPI003677D1BC